MYSLHAVLRFYRKSTESMLTIHIDTIDTVSWFAEREIHQDVMRQMPQSFCQTLKNDGFIMIDVDIFDSIAD